MLTEECEETGPGDVPHVLEVTQAILYFLNASKFIYQSPSGVNVSLASMN